MWEMLTWQVPYWEYGPWQVVAMVTESSKRPEVRAARDQRLGVCRLAGRQCRCGKRHLHCCYHGETAVPLCATFMPASRPTPTCLRPHPPRPAQVPPPDELPTAGFGGEGEYLTLMTECWAQDPDARPTFAAGAWVGGEVWLACRRLWRGVAAQQHVHTACLPACLGLHRSRCQAVPTDALQTLPPPPPPPPGAPCSHFAAEAHAG